MVGNAESSVVMFVAIVTVPSSGVVTTPVPGEAALGQGVGCCDHLNPRCLQIYVAKTVTA